MNLKEIKEMINLMNENNLIELEIERDGARIKIKKASLDTAEVPKGQSVEYRVESSGAPRSLETPGPEPGSGKSQK